MEQNRYEKEDLQEALRVLREGGRKGKNDYADDINTRSMMTNWLLFTTDRKSTV